jgi:hypothetical protein
MDGSSVQADTSGAANSSCATANHAPTHEYLNMFTVLLCVSFTALLCPLLLVDAMPRVHGCVDYPQWIKQKVCDIIFTASSDDERANALFNLQLPTKRGRPKENESDTMTTAFKVFAQCPWERQAEAEIAQGITRKQFLYIARANYCKYLASGRVLPRTRTGPVRELSRAQRDLAARILGTPVFRDGYLRFHENVTDAAAASSTFRRLACMSKMPLDTFGAYLCETCPDIVRRAKIDTAPDMSNVTLEARRAASDVWGGRSVWRYSSQPGPRGGSVNEKGQRPVYWRYGAGPSVWPYFNSFTFMLDAATLSSGDKMKEPYNRTAFQRSDVRYPPEVVQGHDPVGSQVWAMFYVVVHPEFGLVSGPDFMYWGSRTMRGATRHAAGFKCWYVILHECKVVSHFLYFLKPQQSLLFFAVFWSN